MKIWERLYEEHHSKLFLEAMTPALRVSSSKRGDVAFEIETPRGIIQAKHVVHCTNAWSSHLLPGLRGKLYPYLECMTVQHIKDMPNKGDEHTWSFHEPAHYVPEASGVSNGWSYLQQNAVSGMFFFGGTAGAADEILTADDSRRQPSAAEYLCAKLGKHFAADQSRRKLVSSWTGCIARTGDNFPLVGRAGAEISGRHGDNEWIAAGFNGGGMCMSWLSGKAVGEQILGRDINAMDWLPESFVADAAQRRPSLTVESAVQSSEYLEMTGPKSRL